MFAPKSDCQPDSSYLPVAFDVTYPGAEVRPFRGAIEVQSPRTQYEVRRMASALDTMDSALAKYGRALAKCDRALARCQHAVEDLIHLLENPIGAMFHDLLYGLPTYDSENEIPDEATRVGNVPEEPAFETAVDNFFYDCPVEMSSHTSRLRGLGGTHRTLRPGEAFRFLFTDPKTLYEQTVDAFGQDRLRDEFGISDYRDFIARWDACKRDMIYGHKEWLSAACRKVDSRTVDVIFEPETLGLGLRDGRYSRGQEQTAEPETYLMNLGGLELGGPISWSDLNMASPDFFVLLWGNDFDSLPQEVFGKELFDPSWAIPNSTDPKELWPMLRSHYYTPSPFKVSLTDNQTATSRAVRIFLN